MSYNFSPKDFLPNREPEGWGCVVRLGILAFVVIAFLVAGNFQGRIGG